MSLSQGISMDIKDQIIHASSSEQIQVTGSAADLIRAFLSGRNQRTLDAYRQDLEDFRGFAGAGSLDEAAWMLLSNGHGKANGLALAYRASLLERNLSPATTNRRLSALRSLVKVGGTLGMISWKLEVENVRSKAYRDTRGPGRDGFTKLLRQVEARADPKGIRDRAILRLLYDLALRRGEVVKLDLEDYYADSGLLLAQGKGRTEKAFLTLPEPTQQALKAWVEARGTEAGPLFLNFDRAGKGARLTGSGVYYLVVKAGKDVGVETRPHGLRHAAITEALDLSQGDIRSVQKFSRHSDPRTLNLYDDNREDLAGEIAKRVAAGVEP
ncbi:tyrosine-type recombinase/integrase [Acidobacteriota bacterium]